MFETSSVAQLYLQAFGLFYLAVGLGLLFNPESWLKMLEEFKASAALSFVTGILIFSIGACILATHQSWQGWQAILVSLIGWAALIKGFVFLVCPKPVIVMSTTIINNAGFVRLGSFVVIALGAWLMWVTL